MFRFFILLSAATLSSPILGETNERKFRVSNELIESLPSFGVFPVSAASARHSVEFGTFFVGETIQGVVNLRNDFKSDLLIESIKTSCGCTAAHASEEKIGAGASTKLLVKVSGQKTGGFSVNMMVHSNLGDFPILLTATVRSRIDFVKSNYLVEKESDNLDVRLKFNDTSLIKQGSVYRLAGPLDTQFVAIDESSGEATFRISLDNKNAYHRRDFTFVPMVDNTEVSAIQLVLQFKEFLASATKEVYGRDDGKSFSFRLLVKGDLESVPNIDGPVELKITEGSTVVKTQADAKVTRVGPILSVTTSVDLSVLDELNLDHSPAELIIGGMPILFSINRVE